MNVKLHKNDLPKELDFGNKIGIDCEFMGLNFLRDKLCLVQISTGKMDAHIVQLNRESYDAPNLKKLLSNEQIIKIFHYARADLLFIKKYLNINVQNIEDTKLQSKLVRKYTDRHSLKDLIKEFINLDISKQYQTSDFGGDLSESQIKYCANDVIYLHKINELLNEMLKRENRLELYQECLKYVNTRVKLDYYNFPEDIWSH
tara:strand:- start:27 stop:632 length:606 start_codon:yes stop_codon:yes gene_type:complete